MDGWICTYRVINSSPYVWRGAGWRGAAVEQCGRHPDRPGGDGGEDPAEETIGGTATKAQKIQTPAGGGGARGRRG